MLVEAQNGLDRARKKLQGIQELVHAQGPMSEFLEAVFIPDVEREVSFAEQQVSSLQAQMEQASEREREVPQPSSET